MELLGGYVPSPHWKAILDKIDQLQREGNYNLSSRGRGYSNSVGKHESWSCLVKFYQSDGDYKPRHVYEVSTHVNYRGGVEVRFDGPFEDSSDQYWHEMLARDGRMSDAIITEDWHHYTVDKDSKNPGQVDGFGGSEFVFELLDWNQAMYLKAQGFDVTVGHVKGKGDHYTLRSRNVWSQSVIPEKHRHLFKVNAKLQPFKAIGPLDVSDLKA